MMVIITCYLITPTFGSLESKTISSYGYVLERPEQKVGVAIKVDNLSPLTDLQLKELAKYDLLITSASTYNKAAIAKLRNYNPNMKICGYRNVAFIDEYSQDINLARANGWVLKDSAGNEVYEKNYPSLKLVDVGNVQYREWLSSRIHYLMTELMTLDGVFGDNTGALIDPYVVSSRPINPRTGLLYQDNEWRNAMVELVKKAKNETRITYIANGAGLLSGGGLTGFWQNQELVKPLANVVDGVLLEGFIRWENEPWRSASRWKQDVDFLKYLNEANKLTVAWTICKGHPEGATPYQVAMFGYASYLLAISGERNYFRAKGYDEEFYNLTRIAVGNPLEEFHVRNDAPVYEREFSKVLVLVNPTDKNYTLPVGGNFMTIDGKSVAEIELPARNGLILIKKA